MLKLLVTSIGSFLSFIYWNWVA